MTKFIHYSWIVFCIACCGEGRQQDELTINVKPNYQIPLYDSVQLVVEEDTLHIAVNDTAFRKIEFMQHFTDAGVDYLAVMGKEATSLNIYQLNLQQTVKKVPLSKYLKTQKLKTSIYCKSLDQILVYNNKTSLFVTNSSGVNKHTYSFPDNTYADLIAFDYNRPPVMKDSILYAGISPTILPTINQIKNWQVMRQLDCKNNSVKNFYHFPERYKNGLYSFRFLDYSYCYNDRGNFVFSFPADSNLYETNFAEVNLAYNGRGRFQLSDIAPIGKNEQDSSGSKKYHTRDSYGAIFFDPYHKRYLRCFRKKVSEADFYARKRNMKGVLIFNEDLRIIGESMVPEGINLNTLFFTSDGCIYARVNSRDKEILHFVSLKFKEKSAALLAQK